ncbi:MAG: glycosyltransferase [Deltaproteobacteria bacterium]|nr:glycosyltransferase [Deltaproteobacteria bacterium]
MQDKVTIITVTYNDAGNLLKTIDSVVSQTYKNKEYIVIDGGSGDGTRELLTKYDSVIDNWVSEPDEGIFHAMNKGSQKATGEWIIFLNSGDVFFNDHVLEDIYSKAVPANIDVIYGDAVYFYGEMRYKEFRKAGDLRYFWKGLMTSHQSFFLRRKIMERYQFDLRYKVAADFYYLYALYMNQGLFRHIPLYVSLVDTTGVSNNGKMIRSVFEHWCVICKYHRNNLYYHAYYLFRYLFVLLLCGAKKITPEIIYIQTIRMLRCEKNSESSLNKFSVRK